MKGQPWVALVGQTRDGPCGMLLQALRSAGSATGVRPVLIDPNRDGVRPDCRLDGHGLHGGLMIDGTFHDLAQLHGLYLRPFAQAGNAASAAVAQAWIELGEMPPEMLPARIVNPLSRMGSNASKPYQMQRLAEAGFALPPSLLSNEPEEVLAFEARHGELIYKSASGVRSIVHALDATAKARLSNLKHCPALFQKRLRGSNVRVHVVGQSLFATEIDTEVIDYRYAARQGGSTALRATTLAADTAERCLRAAELLGLPFCGIDLMLAEDGQTYCFEANPSPGFSYYEDATGQPIAAELARYLSGLAE